MKKLAKMVLILRRKERAAKAEYRREWERYLAYSECRPAVPAHLIRHVEQNWR